MFRILRPLLLGLVFGACASQTRGPATEPDESCLAVFNEFAAKLERQGFTDSFIDNFEVTEPTVKAVRESSGLHGGKRLTLEKIGATWGSVSTSVDFDPQGDPRWFIETVGAEAAEHFGFKIIDEKTMTVPDPDELLGAIAATNQQLRAKGQEEIGVSFYSMGNNKNTSVTRYTEAWSQSLGLPLAPSGNHLYHDLSFHSGAIFLPNDLLANARARARYRLSFIEHLRAAYPNPTEAETLALKSYAFQLRMQLTQNIDGGTGLVSPSIAMYVKRPDFMRDTPLDEFMSDALQQLTDGKTPPVESYRADIENMLRGSPSSDRAALARHLDAISRDEVMRHFETWSAAYRVPDEARSAFDPARGIGDYDGWKKRICVAITRRRAAIREAALAARAVRP